MVFDYLNNHSELSGPLITPQLVVGPIVTDGSMDSFRGAMYRASRNLSAPNTGTSGFADRGAAKATGLPPPVNFCKMGLFTLFSCAVTVVADTVANANDNKAIHLVILFIRINFIKLIIKKNIDLFFAKIIFYLQ